jgi:hypothetical protein
MATAGPVFTGTAANNNDGGTTAWTNPTNAQGDTTGTAATCNVGANGGTSQRLRCSNFDFSAIPDGSTILGIQVEAERSAANNTRHRWHAIQLLVGGTESGDIKGVNEAITTTKSFSSWGGAADKWGLTPTAAQVKASTFGVSLKINRNSTQTTTTSIFRVRVTVTYENSLRTASVVATGGGVATVDGGALFTTDALYYDSFDGRTVAGSLGTSSDGNDWTNDAGFNVGSGAAYRAFTNGGSPDAGAILEHADVGPDVRVRELVSFSTNPVAGSEGHWVQVYARRQAAADTCYVGSFEFRPGGNVVVRIDARNAGVWEWSVVTTAVAGTWADLTTERWWCEVEVTGTADIAVRAWKAGTSRPTSPSQSGTDVDDPITGAGKSGLRCGSSEAFATTVYIHSHEVWELQAAELHSASPVATGGGIATVSAGKILASASPVVTGGGVATVAPSTVRAGSATATGGGAATASTRKIGQASPVATGGGVATVSAEKVTADVRTASPVATGGGAATVSAQKIAIVAPLMSGGGVVVIDATTIRSAAPVASGGGVATTSSSTIRRASVTATGGGAATVHGERIEGDVRSASPVATGGGVATVVATTSRHAAPVATGGGRATVDISTLRAIAAWMTGGGQATVVATTLRSASVVATGGGVATVRGGLPDQPGNVALGLSRAGLGLGDSDIPIRTGVSAGGHALGDSDIPILTGISTGGIELGST